MKSEKKMEVIKQKALLLLAMAALGYLGYQIYGLMKNDGVSFAPPIETANATEQPVSLANTPTMQRPPLTPEQKAYLHMVNEYELAKMKRRLLEEKAAIAAAERRIALLNKETEEINNANSVATPNNISSPLAEARQAMLQSEDAAPQPQQRVATIPPDEYTIQLMGSYHRDVVENLAIANDLGDHVKQLSIMKSGKPWHVLLYGRYPNRIAAEVALHKLPADLTSENPQVCDLTVLQKNNNAKDLPVKRDRK